jgi:F0F1-type ATP synthase delta subunit
MYLVLTSLVKYIELAEKRSSLMQKYPVTITFSRPLTPEQMREVAEAVIDAFSKNKKGNRNSRHRKSSRETTRRK